MTTKNLIKTIAGLAGPKSRPRLVTNDRVSCPMQASGDVDVDRCYSCAYLTDVSQDADGDRWIRCSTPRAGYRPTQTQC